ncbi:MAG: hypothetical protein ACXQTR_05620 [Candidatus Methanospirareceae archaeon]
MAVKYDVFVKFRIGGEAYCGSFESLFAAMDFIKHLDTAFRFYADISQIKEYVIQPGVEEDEDDED